MIAYRAFFRCQAMSGTYGFRLDVAEANQLPRKVVANHNGLWLDKEHDVDRHQAARVATKRSMTSCLTRSMPTYSGAPIPS